MSKPEPTRVLPVSLLAEGRRAVVVGAGAVAQRKIGHLLDAGAAVSVISPAPPDAVIEQAETGKITLHQRRFVDADVAGASVVFAATDNPEVNAAVQAVCRAQRILCCAVDRNWRKGDFVTPAIIRRNELSVAISTSGKSCRKSRLVKDSLARHLDKVEHADLLIIGTSHEHLSVERREPYHLAGKRLETVGRMLMQIWGIHEFMILNTCNRIEVHMVSADHAETREIIERVLQFDALAPDEYYVKRGRDAFRHAAILTAGLLSQTPGENHIVAQVKEAVASAANAGWAGSMMQGWLSSTLHVAKHIRADAQPLLRAFEIEDLCLDYLAAEHASGLTGPILVLGTGVVGMGIVTRYLEKRAEGSVIWCYHQNRPTLSDTMQTRVQLCDLNGLREQLGAATAVVCATNSPGHVIHQGHALALDQENEVTIIDLAMPRNVAPELNNISAHIRVADLDDLKHWYRREAADMSTIMEQAAARASEHMDMYQKLTDAFHGANHDG